MLRLFHNGHVLTPHGRFERASLLVAGARIREVLPRGAERPLLGREDVGEVDLRGRHLIPGFVDGHFHLRALALKSARCDLSEARSTKEIVQALSRFAHANPGDGAVVGVEWDESGWSRPEFPTRAQLDVVSTTRAVYARRICGHVGVVNTPFLRLLDAPAPFVEADTGLITEAAVVEANRASAPSSAAVERSIEGAIKSLHALGVTAIHDIVTPGDMEAYVGGLRRSLAPLRIDALVVGSLDDLDSLARQTRHMGEEWFRVAGIKRFADGSIGARTAAMEEPYADADTSGELLLDGPELREVFERCAERGVVCAVHAIGDRAVAAALRALEDVPHAARLVRIEHAEILAPSQIDEIARLGVALAVQPNFVRNWGGEGGLYHRRLGEARWALANPFRRLEESGVDFFFGSDGMPPGPLYGIRGATRHPVPGQSIDVASAIRRYTERPHRGGRGAGRLEAEHLADFVVLSGNPLVADTDRIGVEATFVGGEEVFRNS
jgi:predicted amidohydrolase YtcJ